MDTVKIGERELSLVDVLTELEAEIARIESLIEYNESRNRDESVA
ncbi:MAG: hypothetical protein U5O39_07300 [Gammaproteobacteria bacterium]|nr:hypothetical protein [Gammaproteobacteria bacterium]